MGCCTAASAAMACGNGPFSEPSSISLSHRSSSGLLSVSATHPGARAGVPRHLRGNLHWRNLMTTCLRRVTRLGTLALAATVFSILGTGGHLISTARADPKTTVVSLTFDDGVADQYTN